MKTAIPYESAGRDRDPAFESMQGLTGRIQRVRGQFSISCIVLVHCPLATNSALAYRISVHLTLELSTEAGSGFGPMRLSAFLPPSFCKRSSLYSSNPRSTVDHGRDRGGRRAVACVRAGSKGRTGVLSQPQYKEERLKELDVLTLSHKLDPYTPVGLL
jgi:hypothetical protein